MKKNQNIKNIIKIPNGVNKLKRNIHIDSDFSLTVIFPVFILSCTVSIKLSILGILTCFAIFSFLSFTSALVLSEDISISFTSPASTLATSSE